MECELVDFLNTIKINLFNKQEITDENLLEMISKDSTVQSCVLAFYSFNLKKYHSVIKQLVQYDETLKNNITFALEALKHDLSLLEIYPQYINHPQVQLLQLKTSPEKIQFFPEWLKPKKLSCAIFFNPVIYRYLPEHLKNSPQVMKDAVTAHVFYPQYESDTRFGMFFDLPILAQKQYKYISKALSVNPKLYQHLPKEERKNNKIIKYVLNKCFYDKEISRYYDLQHVMPYIDKKYYKRLTNILWIAKAFEDNLPENEIYAECTMLNFCIFLRESAHQNKVIKDFFLTTGIEERFEKLLVKHHDRLYKKDIIPTGLELEIKEFFKDILPNLSQKIKSFVLMKKMNKKLSEHKKHDIISQKDLNMRKI